MTQSGAQLRPVALAVRHAQHGLAAASGEARAHALRAVAELLGEREAEILAANRRDLDEAARAGLCGPLLDRLALNAGKLATLAKGALQLAATDDPVGQAVTRTELDSALVLTQVRSPIGVLLVIFESRPDAVIQIGTLALRSGNGLILKGGAEAVHSNRILVECLKSALARAGLPQDAIAGIEGRAAVEELLRLDDTIDLVIPRGSKALVTSIRSATRIPVLGHAEGICHLYLDRAADPDMAVQLAVDSKCNYPAACNAVETLLVHREFLPRLPLVGAALRERGVELRADDAARQVLPDAKPASELDWGTEYGDLILAIRTVASLEEAMAHIARFGSAHTDSIVTQDAGAAERFLREVDSASVFHNASTRFADGYRYGLGAEVGISTGRVHARGPVGVLGLLTTRWLLRGNGQCVAEYGSGKKSFSHRPLPLG